MKGIFIELVCPRHGLERFVIKVKRRYNITASEIKPLFRNRTECELSALLVGKYVGENEILRYVEEYLRQRRIHDKLIVMKII